MPVFFATLVFFLAVLVFAGETLGLFTFALAAFFTAGALTFLFGDVFFASVFLVTFFLTAFLAGFTVFLLAGLLPLGHAVASSGTANYVAQHLLWQLGDVPVWTLQALVAILATVFSLVMSNVGATVILVPIAISIATVSGGDPAMFALTVAISTSNSFILPTHQVNALIIGPGDYHVVDFLRVGSIMTVIFLVVSLLMLNLVF